MVQAERKHHQALCPHDRRHAACQGRRGAAQPSFLSSSPSALLLTFSLSLACSQSSLKEVGGHFKMEDMDVQKCQGPFPRPPSSLVTALTLDSARLAHRMIQTALLLPSWGTASNIPSFLFLHCRQASAQPASSRKPSMPLPPFPRPSQRTLY